jgi:hypothetical protein
MRGLNGTVAAICLAFAGASLAADDPPAPK